MRAPLFFRGDARVESPCGECRGNGCRGSRAPAPGLDSKRVKRLFCVAAFVRRYDG